MKLNISELDCIFISYDEPNAESHWADLLDKCMWAKRVDGIKGSDACHKAAAELSETDWFITVDADNIVDPKFFNLEIDIPAGAQAISWPGVNILNGLRYGNGSLKVWHKDFVKTMQSHEESTSERGQVDFCWEEGYRPMYETYSTTYPNASAYQAWRAGFREGVKMSLVDGKLPDVPSIQKMFWQNLYRLRVWMSVGAHADNGLWAILGARHGCYKVNCTPWNYVEVRDFDKLNLIWNEVNKLDVQESIDLYGRYLEKEMGLKTPLLDPITSQFVTDTFSDQYRQAVEQVTWVMKRNV